MKKTTLEITENHITTHRSCNGTSISVQSSAQFTVKDNFGGCGTITIKTVGLGGLDENDTESVVTYETAEYDFLLDVIEHLALPNKQYWEA